MSRTVAAVLLVISALATNGRAAFDPARMRLDHERGSFALEPGSHGFQIVDADGSGSPEIFAASQLAWCVLEWEPATGDYVQTQHHEPYLGDRYNGLLSISGLVVGDVEGDGRLDAIVLTERGRLLVHDAATGAERWSRDVDVPGAIDIAVADLDGVPGDELVAMTQRNLFVLDPATGAIAWQVALTEGTEVDVGQVDADPAFEIVVGQGSRAPCLVFDGVTHAIEWTSPTPEYGMLAVGDVDGDGRDEAVFAGTTLRSVDIDLGATAWSVPRSVTTTAMALADMDSDGLPEILLGDSNFALTVRVHEGTDGALRNAMSCPERVVVAIGAGDLDGDCDVDLAYGGGTITTSGTRGLVHVVDPVSETILWESVPMHRQPALRAGDIDADGRSEMVSAGCLSRAPGFHSTHVIIVDELRRGRPERVSSPDLEYSLSYSMGMGLGQLDGDGPLEVVLPAEGPFDARLRARDGVTDAEQWTSAFHAGESTKCIETADVDGDGVAEVFFGTSSETTGARGSFVRELSGSDGTLRWENPEGVGSNDDVRDIEIADIDDDGVLEIVVVSFGRLRTYAADTHALEWNLALSDLGVACSVGDADGDGDLDVVVGTRDRLLSGFADVVAHDGATQAETWRFEAPGREVPAVRVADIDGDGVAEIVIVSATTQFAHVEVRSSADRSLLWRGDDVNSGLAAGNALVVADVDDDGAVEIAASTWYAMFVHEHALALADVTPPSFLSSTGPVLGAGPADRCCVAVDLTWPPAIDDGCGPVLYHVHRGRWPFTPDGSTLAAVTELTSWRDRGVARADDWTYVVRAVDRAGNDDGNTANLSVVVADPPECDPLATLLRVHRPVAGELELEWDAVPAAAAYDLYVGTLSSPWTAQEYDHVHERAGVTFPGAASASSGCNVGNGPATSGRVAGVNFDAYFLIVARDALGRVGPFGITRTDPRPPSLFCP